MIRVLFVCLGNICRSPLAEGIFRDLVMKEGLDVHFLIDSAGTASYHTGELADPRTRKVALSRGVELLHRARTFSMDDFEAFDMILPMDQANALHINRLKPEGAKARVLLMREFDTQEKGSAVPDPYYGELSHFDEVHTILERSCSGLLQELKKQLAVGL